MNTKAREAMRLAACYAPALSQPIIDAIADLDEKKRTNIDAVVEASKQAIRNADGRAELGALFSDLICALNGTDYLPFVAGVALGEVLRDGK